MGPFVLTRNSSFYPEARPARLGRGPHPRSEILLVPRVRRARGQKGGAEFVVAKGGSPIRFTSSSEPWFRARCR